MIEGPTEVYSPQRKSLHEPLTERKACLAAVGKADGRWPYPKASRGKDGCPAPRRDARAVREAAGVGIPALVPARSSSDPALTLCSPSAASTRLAASHTGGPGQFYELKLKAPEEPDTPGPFYDVENRGGKHKSVVTSAREKLCGALMGDRAAKRFQGTGGESYGLRMSTGPDLGPGQYIRHTLWVPGSSASDWRLPECRRQARGDAPFRDTCPRIQEKGPGAWMVLAGRTREPNGDMLEIDEKLKHMKFNGALKGMKFTKGARNTNSFKTLNEGGGPKLIHVPPY
eukprot:TRINITY_DN31003_c0_g1_i1.p1 TRINITY_DN31003_c0_g1~~TRINITY_DN31003_c0_g1_i1.p1  ORF type:complete len:316 (+),score=48.08 TRINITY_DN31003_c0_g1_i1:93-950(+)